jgi:hypothetical protein
MSLVICAAATEETPLHLTVWASEEAAHTYLTSELGINLDDPSPSMYVLDTYVPNMVASEHLSFPYVFTLNREAGETWLRNLTENINDGPGDAAFDPDDTELNPDAVVTSAYEAGVITVLDANGRSVDSGIDWFLNTDGSEYATPTGYTVVVSLPGIHSGRMSSTWNELPRNWYGYSIDASSDRVTTILDMLDDVVSDGNRVMAAYADIIDRAVTPA